MRPFAVAGALTTAVLSRSASAADLRVGFSQGALTLDAASHRKRETETIIRTRATRC